MKKNIKRIGIGVGVGILILGTTISFSEPGSDRDPLVTMSYVDKKIEQIKYYIDEKTTGSIGTISSNEFLVVEIAKGQSIILGGGSEAILRSGEARAISRVLNGIDNGLADVTLGKDIQMNELVRENHLLLTPRDDGRGLKATKDSIFLIKGSYEVK